MTNDQKDDHDGQGAMKLLMNEDDDDQDEGIHRAVMTVMRSGDSDDGGEQLQ